MGNPTWPEKLRESLTDLIGLDRAEKLMAGSEHLKDMSPGDRADWVRGAMARLDREVPDEASRYEIMARCSCGCVDSDTIAKLRKLWQETEDIDRLLDAMYGNPFLVRPIRNGDEVIFTKIPFDQEGYAVADTAFEKQYCYCHCDWVRGSSGDLSPTHCFCSAGWYKNMMEKIMERSVTVRLVKSVLQGDEVCQFSMEL